MVVEQLSEMKLLKELVEARYSAPDRPKPPTKIIHKIVRKAVDDNDWLFFYQYNDKRKNDRRLSYGGPQLPKEKKERILSQVKRDLKRGNLPGRAYWHTAMSHRGPYPKLVIDQVPLETKNIDDERLKLKSEKRRIQSKGLAKPDSSAYERISQIHKELEGLSKINRENR